MPVKDHPMRIAMTLALLAITFTSALAKERPPIELMGSLSWSLSEGINYQGGEVDLPGGETAFFNRLDISDEVAFGAGIGVYLSRNREIAFLWDYQSSELVAQGSRDLKIADLGIDNYHLAFINNFGSPLDRMRPFLFGGLGMTYFRGIEFEDQNGQTRQASGDGQFSTTWGGGVKFALNERFGFSLEFKWTPTYVKSDPAGYWCDPLWGCYTTSDADYVNQWKFGGTLLARF
jgi:opacity protein-like surface antigen